MTKWHIGNIKIDNQVVLAPMAGVTNQAFREVCKEFGCGLVYGEMVSDKALLFDNQQTKKMTAVSHQEKPITLQLFGSEVTTMVKSAMWLDQNSQCDIIDINMGCPVPKIVKNGSGSALMKTPQLASDIVSEIVKKVSKPVTVKIRAGWDKQSINAVAFAQMLQQAGAAALAVHPRTRSEMYQGKSNWQIIKDVKQAVTIPVIGNGDIKTAEDAMTMLKQTGCDAVMIGRGAFGNPWLIKEVVDCLAGNPQTIALDYHQIIQYIKHHYQKLSQLKGEKIAIMEMRAHTAWYLSGLPHSTRIKQMVNAVTTEKALFGLLDWYETALALDPKQLRNAIENKMTKEDQ